MAVLMNSFIRDVSQSILDDMETAMGRGSDTYPTPPYLQIDRFAVAGGVPQLRPVAGESAVIWLEYIAGGRTGSAIGRLNAVMTETFNCYAHVRIDRQILGDRRISLPEFVRACEAAGDTTMRRMWKCIEDWSGVVTDPIIGGSTNGAEVSVWSFVLTSSQDYLAVARVMLGLDVNVE